MAAQKKSKKPASVLHTEKLLQQIVTNQPGQLVNGRQMHSPDVTLFNRMEKKKNSVSPLRRDPSSVLKPGKPLDEETQQEVKEFTNGVLSSYGSVGGNKTLFVNAKLGLLKNRDGSPLGHLNSVSSSGF